MRLRPAMILVATLAISGACEKKEKVPDHVLQQRRAAARERAAKKERAEKRRAAASSASSQPSGEGGGAPAKSGEMNLYSEKFSPEKWPEDVRRITAKLFGARFHHVPALARQLAQRGSAAIQALTYLATHPQQPIRKRAMISMMAAEMQMFRPEALAELAGSPKHPFLQRAAIERLARLRHPSIQKLLAGVRRREKPMASFIDAAKRRSEHWPYDKKQLRTLDRILFAPTKAALRKRLSALEDLTLEKGLEAILTTPVASRARQGLVAKRLGMLASHQPKELRRLTEKRYPPLLRVAALEVLVASDRAADHAFATKLSQRPRDPLGRIAKKLLAKASRHGADSAKASP